jgi:hypothetical protein
LLQLFSGCKEKKMFPPRFQSRLTIALAALVLGPLGCAHPSTPRTQASAQQVCAGLSDKDRALGPFAHPELIESVAPLLEQPSPKSPQMAVSGSVVTLRASDGMTAARLQQIVDCHLAVHDGAGASAHGACPLAWPALVDEPLAITVHPAGASLAVQIRTSRRHGDEVLARSRALADRR